MTKRTCSPTAGATHYLWEADELKQVWIKGGPGKLRRELAPSEHDVALYESFRGYRSRFVRCPRFFSNGRINASADMTLDSLLTPRAQHNLDLLMDAIGRLSGALFKRHSACVSPPLRGR